MVFYLDRKRCIFVFSLGADIERKPNQSLVVISLAKENVETKEHCLRVRGSGVLLTGLGDDIGPCCFNRKNSNKCAGVIIVNHKFYVIVWH